MVTSTSEISKSNIDQVLSKIRDISSQTKALSDNKITEPDKTSGFDSIISNVKNSLGKISETQNESQNIKNAYIHGDPNVSLSQVLVSSAQSKVAFEGLIAVRKHLIEAYKEIMNMPI